MQSAKGEYLNAFCYTDRGIISAEEEYVKLLTDQPVHRTIT